MFTRIKQQRDLAKELEVLHHEVPKQIAPGDLVMVKDLSALGKLALKTKGPFLVQKILPGGSIIAKNTESGKIIRIPASHAYRYTDTRCDKSDAAETLQVKSEQKLPETITEQRRPGQLRNLKPTNYKQFF